jgi:hypothetical protein
VALELKVALVEKVQAIQAAKVECLVAKEALETSLAWENQMLLYMELIKKLNLDLNMLLEWIKQRKKFKNLLNF